MNDLSAPPRKRPPARDAKRAAPMSRESRFIGYVVLGFGVLAVVAVLILAFSGEDVVESAAVPDAARVEAITQELRASPEIASIKPKQAVPPPRPANELAFKRQSGVSADSVSGSWQAMIGRYTSVVQMDGQVYQIIMASPDPAAARTYSSGTYKVIDDIITFEPHPEWPEPSAGAGKALPYSKLTRAPFSLLVGFQKDRMLWQNVPPNEKRVLTTPKSPLFLNEDADYVVWQKIAR